MVRHVNGIKLINNDALITLDDLINDKTKVDLIICDPPYKILSGGKSNNNKDTSQNSPGGILSKNNGKLFTHYKLDETEWFPKIYELLADNSQCYIMTNSLNLELYLKLARKTGFKLHNLLVWQKNTCTPSRWYLKNCEYTLFLRKGKAKTINIKNSKTVHTFNNPRNKRHPTEKPLELMALYIENSSNVHDTVLDFAMGCGTTGVACQKLNRNFIGIEIDKDYFNIAKQRMSTTINI